MRQSLRRRARVISAVVLAILILRMDPPAHANTYDFVATTGLFRDGTLWKDRAIPNLTGKVPELHDSAVIGSTMFFAANVELDDERTLQALTIAANSTLRLTGGLLTVDTLTLGGGNLTGSIVHQGGFLKPANVMVSNASQFEVVEGDEITPQTIITVTGSGSQLYYNHANSDTMSTLNLAQGAAASLVSGVLHTAYLNFGMDNDFAPVTLFHNSGTLDVQTNLHISAGNIFTVMAGDTFTTATVIVSGSGSTLKLNSDLTSVSVDLSGGAAVDRNGGFFHVHDLDVQSGSTLTALSGDSIAAGGKITVIDVGSVLNLGSITTDRLASVIISNGGTLQYNTLTTDSLLIDNATLSGGGLNFSRVDIYRTSLDIGAGDTVTDGAVLSADAGGTITYNNPQNHLLIVQAVGGTINLSGGVLHVDSIGVDGGTFNRGGATFTDVKNITIGGGSTFTVAPTDTTAGGGAISVAGQGSTLNLTNDFDQQAASVSVTGGGVLNLDGHNLNTQALSITSGPSGSTPPGMINRGGGHISLSSIALQSGASFTIEPDDQLTSGGTIRVINAGTTLTYDNSSSALVAQTTIQDGTLVLQSGTLHTQNLDLGDSSFFLPAHITRNGGALSVTSFAIIENGSSLQTVAGDDFTGALLWVRLGASLDLAGNTLPVKNLMLDGALNRNGGGFSFQQLSVNNGSTFAIGPEDTVADGGSISSASSILSIERDITTPLASVYLEGSTLQLNGHALRTDSLSIVNSTVARAGGRLNLQSITVSSPGSTFDLEPTDTLRDGGTLTIQNQGTVLNYNNTPIVENNGNDNQPADAPVGTINQVTINDGATLNLQGGTLQTFFLNLGDTLSTGNLIRSGGNLEVVYAADVAGGSTLTIGPDDDFSTASLTVEAGSTLDLAGHTLAVSSLNLGGTLIRDGGHFLFGSLGVSAGQNFTLTNNDDIAPDGYMQVSGSGAVLTVQSVLSNPLSSTVVSDGGVLNLSTDIHTRQLGINGGTVNRLGGILDIQYLSVSGGSALTLTSHDILEAGGSIDVEGEGSILDLIIPAVGVANEALSSVAVAYDAILNLNGRDLVTDQLSVTGGTLNHGGAKINVQSLNIQSGGTFSVESADTLRGGGSIYVSNDSVLSLAVSPTGDVNSMILQYGATINLNGHALQTDFLEADGSTLNRGGAALNLQTIILSQGSTLALIPGDAVRGGGGIFVADPGSELDLGVSPGGALMQLFVVNGAVVNLNGHDITADSLAIDAATLDRGGAHLNVQSVALYDGSSFAFQSGDTFRGGGGVVVEGDASTLDLHSSPGTPVAQTSILDGGTLNLNGHAYSSSYFQLGSTTHGVLNRAGASLSAQDVRIYAGSILDIVTGDSLGSINIVNAGSTLNVNGPLSASLGDILIADNAVANFNAGAVTVTSLQGIDASTANFNGASLSPSASSPNWIYGLAGALVQTGGAKFNTNGYDVTISASLAHDPALGATPDGGLTKNGLGTLVLSGVNTYTGLTTVAAGALAINGSIPGPVEVDAGATLKGTGVTGPVTVLPGGHLAPGNSPGTLSIAGLNLMSGSTFEYELGAVRDHIVVTNSGSVVLGGLLDLSILSGFDPSVGQTFSLFEGSIGSITGAFSAVNAPIFNGHALNLVYGTNQVTLVVGDAGDFNGDGTVDAADYVVWRKGLGTIYTQNDYDAWRSHFGQTAGGGSGAGTNTSSLNRAVPEPATAVLLILAAASFCPWRRRNACRANALSESISAACSWRWFMRRTLNCGPFVLAAMTLLLALTMPLRLSKAANLFWDGTGTSWNTPSFWSTSASATTPNPAAKPGSADIADFNITTVNSTQTVNLDAAQSALGLVFGSTGTVLIQTGSGTNTLAVGSSGITVNAGAGADTISSAVSLAAGESWTNNSSNLLTVSGTVSAGAFSVGGSGDTTLSGSVNTANNVLTKTGSGTLTLSGATDNNSLPVTVNSGTVVLAKTSSGSPSNVHAIGQDTLTVSGGTAQLGGTGGDQIYDLGSVAVTSGAFDTNARSETFSTLNLQGTGIGGAGALVNTAAGASTITPTSGTTLNAATTIGVTQSTGSLTLNNVVSGNFELTKVGAGTLNLSAANSFSGGLAVANGILQTSAINNAGTSGPLGNNMSVTLGSSGQTGTLEYTGPTASSNMPLTLATSGTGAIQVDTTSNDLTLQGIISGSGALSKSGPGALSLSGANTYSGTTTLTAGTLVIGSDSALGTGTLNLAGGAVQTSGPVVARVLSNAVAITGDFAVTGIGFPIPLEFAGITTLTGNRTITANGDSLTVSGNMGQDIAGRSLTKSGGGFLTLSGNNTFSGGVNLNAGGLSIGSNSALGSGPLNVAGGSIFSNSGAWTVSNTVTLGSDVLVGGSITFSGPVTLTGNRTISSNSLGTFSGSIGQDIAGRSLTVAGFELDPTFTVRLSGNNTFSGGVNLTSGTLLVGNNSALGSGALNLAGGTIGANGAAHVISNALTISNDFGFGGSADLTLSSPTTLTANRIIAVTGTGIATLSGAIGQDVAGRSLTKSGDGTLRLSGNNTFSGGVTLNAGTLLVGSDSAIGNGALNLAGGTIEADGAARVLSNALTISGDIAFSGSEDLTLSSPTTLTSHRTITVTGSGTATLAGGIGSGVPTGITKSGAGTLRLSHGNAFDGEGVTVTDGTLLIASNSALGTSLTIDGGAVDLGTFSLGGAQLNFITGSLSLTGNLSVGSGGLLGPNPTIAANQTVNITGTTTIDPAANLTINGGTLSTAALAINGTFNFFGGTLGITGPAGLTIGSGSLLGTTVSLGTGDRLNATNTLHINSAGRLTNVGGNVLAGNVQLDAGGRWTVSDGVQSVGTGLVNHGTLVLIDTTINGPVNSPAGSVVNVIGGVTFNQLVSGAGQFFGSGTTTFNGGYHPGDSPATVNFQGGVALGSGNTLAMELGGLTPGAQYDQVQVAGQLLLGGTLAVSSINGFTPVSGNSFDILNWGALSGTFSTIVLPTLSGGLAWNTSQLYTAGILSIDSVGLPGDYNYNGVVDAADYVVWRQGLGTTYTQSDYGVWRSHFGQMAGSGSADVANAMVPEPASMLVLVLGTLAMCSHRRRRVFDFAAKA